MQPAFLFVQFDDRHTESKPFGRQSQANAEIQVGCHLHLSSHFHIEREASSFRKILDPKFRLCAFAALGERAFPLA